MILLYIFITIITFSLMEIVTWLTHKFVMHGFMWYFHEDHHQPGYKGFFERNDVFFIIGAVPSILLFYFGVDGGLNYLFFIGLGLLFYGIAYFLVHDVFIHRRLRLFGRSKSRYLKALRKGHKAHHKHLGKEEGESFGMLFVPKKYYK